MKKYENIYVGVGRKKKSLVGGIDVERIEEGESYLFPFSQLDIYTDKGVKVGYISVDALKLAFQKRKKGEPAANNAKIKWAND